MLLFVLFVFSLVCVCLCTTGAEVGHAGRTGAGSFFIPLLRASVRGSFVTSYLPASAGYCYSKVQAS